MYYPGVWLKDYAPLRTTYCPKGLGRKQGLLLSILALFVRKGRDDGPLSKWPLWPCRHPRKLITVQKHQAF